MNWIEIISNYCIGFWIVLTGVHAIPEIVRVSGHGMVIWSYTLCICFLTLYFTFYKAFYIPLFKTDERKVRNE